MRFYSLNQYITFALGISFFLASSCARKDYSLECGAKDQWKAFAAPLESMNSNTILVDSEFDETQMSAIQNAVTHWNAEAAENGKGPIYNISVRDLSQQSTPQNPKDCNFSGSANEFSIRKIYDPTLSQWHALGLSEANPAVTIRCAQKGGAVKKQNILVNQSLYQSLQFKTIMLHELGHATGLDHSCTFDEVSDQFINCVGLDKAHPYRKAVMYPTLSLIVGNVSASDKKEILNENDKTRAQCVINAQ